jgi:hypothetical protein
MTISMHSVGSAEAASWPRLPLTFATLMSALRSNNLTAARQAYDDLARGLQPQVGRLIAPVGAALGAGNLAQAGRMLGQMRGELATAATFPSTAAPAGATGGDVAVVPASAAAPIATPGAAPTAPSALAPPDTASAASLVLNWLV